MAEPIPPFGNHLPVRIRFGEGAVAALNDVLAAESTSRPFVIVDDFMQGVPAVASALQGLEEAGRYAKSAGEPTIDDVEDAADRLAASDADAVVAIGGGSVIDTAKAARLVVSQREPFRRFAAREVAYEPPVVPLVAIPTTAGTGSEVSGGAVITDAETNRKAGIANPFLRAQHALVDPELTYGLPSAPTAHSGIDAIAQAIAAIVVETRTPVGDAIALEAIRLGSSRAPGRRARRRRP